MKIWMFFVTNVGEWPIIAKKIIFKVLLFNNVPLWTQFSSGYLRQKCNYYVKYKYNDIVYIVNTSEFLSENLQDETSLHVAILL